MGAPAFALAAIEREVIDSFAGPGAIDEDADSEPIVFGVVTEDDTRLLFNGPVPALCSLSCAASRASSESQRPSWS